jgi:hypothetical protein
MQIVVKSEGRNLDLRCEKLRSDPFETRLMGPDYSLTPSSTDPFRTYPFKRAGPLAAPRQARIFAVNALADNQSKIRARYQLLSEAASILSENVTVPLTLVITVKGCQIVSFERTDFSTR